MGSCQIIRAAVNFLLMILILPCEQTFVLVCFITAPFIIFINIFQMADGSLDPLIDCLKCNDAEILRVTALVLNIILVFPLMRALYVHFKTRGGFHLFYT